MRRGWLVFFFAVVAPLLMVPSTTMGRPSSHGAGDRLKTWQEEMPADTRRLLALSRELDRLSAEIEAFGKASGHKERGHFTSAEHDRIENFVFRYLACRSALWDLVDRYGAATDVVADSALNARAFILAFTSASHLYYYSSRFVQSFMLSEPVIEKLNEAYHRSGIPENTYRTVFLSVTSVDNLERMRAARVLFEEEARTEDSAVASVVRDDPTFAAFVTLAARLCDAANTQTEAILRHHALLLPNVRNRLRHSMVAEMASTAKDQAGSAFDAARAVLFVNVSRLKSPFEAPIVFSSDQLLALRSLMQPGDVVLTFSGGYMSNLFLPGAFKHGLTYIGSPGDRVAAGLSPEAFSELPETRRRDVVKQATTEEVAPGRPADLVEAIAEGVIFSSLHAITDSHINRLLVLRPKITRAETVQQLVTVFSLVGDDYDFGFDFDDGSEQCCTEVTYRSLHRVGPIRFSLVKRAGAQTLAADDIINYHLDTQGAFAFVLLAEEIPTAKGHPARILTGAAGESRLRQLMGRD